MRGYTLQQLLILIKRIKRRLVSSKVARQLRLQLKRIDAFVFRVPRRYLIAHRHTRFTRFLNKLYAFRGAAVVVALVLVFHILSPALTPQLAFALNGNANLNGFIWENDDDSSPDGNTQLAAGNGSVTVPKGTRLNLRTQIKNTGTAMDLSKLGLFYDRGDGMWSRVRNTMPNKPDGDSFTNPTFMIDRPNIGASNHMSNAIDSAGNIWVSYGDGSTTLALRVAKYVGSGGTGCSSSAWTCTDIDNVGNNVAAYNSIAIDASGNPWISYYNNTTSALKVANYVGSGGNCTSAAWNCTTVDNTGTQTGQYTSIAFDSTGAAWVSFYDTTNTALRVAKYVGTGGNCTSTAWNCSAVDNTGTSTGQFTSIAVDSTNTPWVSYYDTGNTSLRVAKYVGSGGNCTDAAWNCSAVDNTGTSTGQYTSIAINPLTNRPWVSYQNVTGTSLKVADFVSSGGGCTDTAWNCTTVDNLGTSTGEATSITFDAAGAAWVSYRDVTNTAVKLAKYTMPHHNNFACTDTNWNCMTIEGVTTGINTTDVAIDENGHAQVVFFGDNYDGIFIRKVTSEALAIGEYAAIPSFIPGCPIMTGFTCNIVDGTTTVGQYSSIAVGPNGIPWISYFDTTSTQLKVAMKYSAYDDNNDYCSGQQWDCTAVDNSATSTGTYSSIAIDANGAPWVSYWDATLANQALRVAKYVGSGGNCTSAAWNCSTVDNTGTRTGEYTSIAIDASGNPWVSYYDSTNTSLRVAKYVGSGGNCTDTAWNCSAVDNTNSVGLHTSIAIDASGNPWVSYWDSTNTSLRVAKYVGSGGNCTDAAWNCSTVDNTGTSTGQMTAIAIDPAGNPWVGYQDVTNLDLKVAKYVGSGGNCTDTAWNCSAVEADGLSLSYGTLQSVSMAMDPAGNPTIAYRDGTSASLRLAKYVGSGGNCTDTAWRCFTIDDDTVSKGGYTGIAFDHNGKMWISYESAGSGQLKVAYSIRQGEIVMASSERASGSLAESHVDMTTTSDTTNRDDADCVGGGTWNNGVMVFGDAGPIGTLADGTGTAQCTELVFTIDLSQAQIGATYRFMVASLDNFTSGKSLWRGPISIAGGATPTLTISKNTTSLLHFSKSNNIRLPDCTDTAWGCNNVVTTDDVGSFGSATNLTMDRQGKPWTAYYNATSGDLAIAKYVGTGGTGCTTSAWDCTVIDSTNDVGKYSSLVFDEAGNPWVSYYDATNGNLRVAKYVGSSGTGCASSAWTCTAVDTTNDVGQYSSIVADLNGNPVISYYDLTGGNLRVAQYLGGATTGTGCASNAWTCTAVDTTNDVGQYSSITLDFNGFPWVSYYDATNGDLRVARSIPMGGSSGCAVGTWLCETVESTNDVGKYSAIQASQYGVAIVYYESASGSCDNTPTSECSLHIAQRFSSLGAAGCASANWRCDIVDNPTGTGDLGKSPALTIDNTFLYVSYYDAANGDLKVARYDTNEPANTGSGCSLTTDWYCGNVDTTNDVGAYSSIITTDDGTKMIAYYDTTNGNLRTAKLHRDTKTFSTNTSNQLFSGGRQWVGSYALGRFGLSLGRTAAAADGSCSGASSDYLGMCALYHNNGDYDTVVAQTNESPMLSAIVVRTVSTEYPTIRWTGKTSLAPNTAGTAGDIVMQVFNVSTLTWETIATNSTSSDCNSDNCTLTGIVASSSDTYDQNYYIYNAWPQSNKAEMVVRIYQEASSSTGITFKTDQFSAFTTSQKMGTGSLFQDGVERPLNQR